MGPDTVQRQLDFLVYNTVIFPHSACKRRHGGREKNKATNRSAFPAACHLKLNNILPHLNEHIIWSTVRMLLVNVTILS